VAEEVRFEPIAVLSHGGFQGRHLQSSAVHFTIQFLRLMLIASVMAVIGGDVCTASAADSVTFCAVSRGATFSAGQASSEIVTSR
jgi:hypothetical protein